MTGQQSSDHTMAVPASSWRPRRFVGAILLLAAHSLAQSPPEPPLPERSSKADREAAAAIQAPKHIPPPPLPPGVTISPVAAPPGISAPPPASPIPPQSGPAPAAPQPSPSSVRGQAFPSQVSTSTSSSGQFVVHGPDLQIRGYFAAHCDEVAGRLRQLLRDDQSWSLPIVVALKLPPDVDPAAPAVKTSISKITHGGFHLQLALQVRHDLRLADLDRELIRILLAERILRPHKDIATTRSSILPDWLLTGVNQALAFRTRSRPSAVFAAVFRTGRIYGIEEILSASVGDLDALSRSIYETSCCALVLALLDQTEGPARFSRFLGSLAADNREDRELLAACFPALALSASSLNKWWSIQMASLATPSVFETLGPTATKNELEAALTFTYQAAPADVPRQTRVIAAPKPDALPITEEEPVAEEKKRGLLGRMFGGSSAKNDETNEAKADAPPAAADSEKAESKKDEPKKEPAAEDLKKTAKPKAGENPSPAAEGETEKRPGLIRRMFGGSKPDEAEPAKEDEPAKKSSAKPKPEVKEAPPPEPKPQPKKEEAEPPADQPKKDAAPLTPGAKRRLFGARPPSLAEPAIAKFLRDYASWQTFGLIDHPAFTTGPRHTALFGKKKKTDEAAEPEKPDPKKAEAKKEAPKKEDKKKEEPKEQPKPEPKAEKRADGSEPAADEKPKRSGLFSIFGRKPKDEPEAEPAAEPAKPEATSKPRAKSKPAAASAAASSQATVPVSIPLEDYPAILKRKDRTAIIDRNVKALNLLSPRSHVLFRPIIAESAAIMVDLDKGKAKDIDKRIAAVRAAIAAAWKRGKAVEEHLDWFEASETNNYSGLFEDYLRLPAQIQTEAPARTDAISQHLDELERK